MRTIPIDCSKLNIICVDVLENLDQDGKVRISQDGERIWKLQCLVRAEGDEKATLIDINVRGEKPNVSPLSPVELDGFVCRGWAMGDRSGISFSASSVTTAGGHKTKVMASSSNGSEAA